MPATVVQYSFSSGEVSPRMWMRGDVEAYPHAAKKVENFFIDYRGGAVSRPGTEYVGVARGPMRNVPIQLAFIPEGGLILEATDKRFRFIQNGVYVTEAAKIVSSVSGTQVTIVGHGYAVDDWLLVEGKQVRVSNVISADVIELEDILGNSFVPSVGDIAGRIYELATPYAEEHLFELNFTQLEGAVVICHNSYAPRLLEFHDLTNWTLTEIQFSTDSFQIPSGLTATPTSTASNNAYYIYAVSAVMSDGTETNPSVPIIIQSDQMSTVNGASIKLQWNVVPGAAYYVIYRSREFLDTRPNLGEQLGFAGKAYGTEFVDKNIVPDFTKQPIVPNDPFAPGVIEAIYITAEGSGYLETSTVSVTGASTGYGFYGYPIVTKIGASGGVLGAIKILNGGRDYDEPVTVNVTDGTGATFDVKVRPLSGNWPRCSARFQQRLVFGGTGNKPSTIWGSKPGSYFDFSYSVPSTDDDSYEHSLDTRGIQYINYLLPVSSGLMVFTDGGIYTVSGDSTGKAVTPLRVQVLPQMSLGATRVDPIVIDNDVLFVQSKGLAVRSLRFNPVTGSYSAEDLTLLSSHLLQDYGIKDWDYAATPFRLLTCVREDGQLLFLTYMPSQQLFAWSRALTDGRYQTVASIKEGGINRLYVGVKREIAGKTLWFQELFDTRKWNTVRGVFAVDCGLKRTPEVINSSIRVNSDGTFVTTATVNVGDLIVVNGARLEVTGSGVANVLVEPVSGWPIEESSFEVYRGKATNLTGLEHLEGKEVAVLADGNVLPHKTVVNGAITIDIPAWEIVVGLPYTCRLETLPIDIMQPAVQGKKRRYWKADIFVQASRGLWVGTDFNNLWEVKERDLATIGQPIELYTGFRRQVVTGRWEQGATLCIEVRDPVPATVLGIASVVTFGDDDEG